MDHINNKLPSQTNIGVQSKIDDFYYRFKIATLMHQSGVRKHHASLAKAIFTLPFVGKNFFKALF